MARALWLPDVLRDIGLPVTTVPGWESRGRSLTRILGYVSHDTVTSRSWSDERVIKLLRDGRPDVPGPLSQLGMDRTGTLIVVAAGRANHNGYGEWGNDSIGCEVFCAGGLPGQEEPYNAVQREHSAMAAAAILGHLGLPASRHKGHKETDPNRKIDPFGVDMGALRERTHFHMNPPPEPTKPAPEEDDMARLVRDEQGRVYKVDGNTRTYINEGATIAWLQSHGHVPADIENIPTLVLRDAYPIEATDPQADIA